MKFKTLGPGDRIALVAPASPFSGENFQLACALLKQKGYELHLGRHLFRKQGYLAGTESERAEDLLQALLDPGVGAVVCVRGGYGSGTLIPWIPLASLSDKAKPFVGYSDITFLHQALQSQGEWVTFHGPNLMDLGQHPEGVEHLSQFLQGLSPFEWTVRPEQVLRHGTARGVLRGGNLTCLSHLLGTAYMPDLTHAILFVEDRGEALYRLDRVMTHLKLTGHLDGLKGMVLGQFKDCDAPFRIWEMILQRTHAAGMPIFADMPFGHSWPNDILPLGATFLMDSTSGTFRGISRLFER